MIRKGVNRLFLLINYFLRIDYKFQEEILAKLKKIKSKIELILFNETQFVEDDISDGSSVVSLLRIPEISIIFSTLWLFIESDLHNVLVDNRSIYVRFFSSLYQATLEGNESVATEFFLDKEWQLDEQRFEHLDYQSFCSFIYEKLDSWVSMLPEPDILLFVLFLFDAIFDYDYYEKHEKIALKELQNIHSILEFGENMELFLHHFSLEDFYVYPGALRIKDSVKTSLSHALTNLNKIHRNETATASHFNQLHYQHSNSQLSAIQPPNEALVAAAVAVVTESSHHRHNHTVILGQGITEGPRRHSDVTPYTDEDTESRPTSPLEEGKREGGDGHPLEGSPKQLPHTRTRRHAEEVLVDLGIIHNYDTLENIETELQNDVSNALEAFPVVTVDTRPSASAAAHAQPLTDSSMTTNKSRNTTIPRITSPSVQPASDLPSRNVSPSKLTETGETTINMRLTDPDSLEASLRIISRQSSPKNDSQLYAHLNKKLHNQLQQQQRVHDVGRRRSISISKVPNQHANTILPSVSYSNASRATSPHTNQPTASTQASTARGTSFVTDDYYPSAELVHRNLLESNSPDGTALSLSHYNSKELKPYLQRNNRSDPLSRLEQQRPTVKLVLREKKGITPMTLAMINITATPANKAPPDDSQLLVPPQFSLLAWTDKVLSHMNLSGDDLTSPSRDSAAESGIGSDALSRQRSDVTACSDLSRNSTGNGRGGRSAMGLTAEEVERVDSTSSHVSRDVSVAMSDVGDLLGVDTYSGGQAVAAMSFFGSNQPSDAPIQCQTQSQSLGISITRRDSAGGDMAGPPSAVSNSSHVSKLSFSHASGEESGTPASYLRIEEITSPDISPRIPSYLGDGLKDTSEEKREAKSSPHSPSNSSAQLLPISKKVTINDDGLFNENSSADINSQAHSLQCDLPDGYSWVLTAEAASSSNISVLTQPSGEEGATRGRGSSHRVDFLPSVMPSWNLARARASRAPHRLFPLSFYNSHIDTSTIKRGVNFGHKNPSNHHYPKSHSFSTTTDRRSISPLPTNSTYLTPHSVENGIPRPLSPIESTAFLTELVNKPIAAEEHPPHSIRKISSQGNLRNGHPLMPSKSETGIINQSAPPTKVDSDDAIAAEAGGASEVMLSATASETAPLPAATPQSVPFKLSLNKVQPRRSVGAAPPEPLTRSSSPVANKLETFTKDNIFDLQGKSNPKLTKEKNKKSSKLKPIQQEDVSNTPELFINSITRPLGSRSLHSLHDPQRSEYLPLSSTATPWPAPSGLHCMETDKLDSRFAWEDRKDLLLHAHNDTGKITLALKHQKLVKRSFESYVKNAPSRIHKLEQLRANKPLVLYGMNGE